MIKIVLQKKLAGKFEAMFVQMMLKSVRQANETIKSDLMGSSAVDTFEEMYHNELSQVMAANDAFGISDWLVEGMSIIKQILQRMRDTMKIFLRMGCQSMKQKELRKRLIKWLIFFQ